MTTVLTIATHGGVSGDQCIAWTNSLPWAPNQRPHPIDFPNSHPVGLYRDNVECVLCPWACGNIWGLWLFLLRKGKRQACSLECWWRWTQGCTLTFLYLSHQSHEFSMKTREYRKGGEDCFPLQPRRCMFPYQERFKTIHRSINCSVVSDSFATPWTVTCQAPLSVEFPGKNTGVGCHFLL